MYPMLREDAELFTYFDEKSGKLCYGIVTGYGKKYSLSRGLYYDLLHADGTRELDLQKSNPDIVNELIRLGVLRNSRLVRYADGAKAFIVKPLRDGPKHLRRNNNALKYFMLTTALISLAVGIFLLAKTAYYDLDINVPVYIMLCLISIIMHEFGHVIAARAEVCNMHYAGILFMGKIPACPCVVYKGEEGVKHDELFISLAGAEMNLLLAGLYAVMAVLFPQLGGTFWYSSIFNICVTVINLLPGKGYDGEAALSAVLKIPSIYEKAVRCLKSRLRRRSILRQGFKGYLRILAYAAVFLSNYVVRAAFTANIAVMCILAFRYIGG